MIRSFLSLREERLRLTFRYECESGDDGKSIWRHNEDGVWEAPEKMPVIEKAARITPQLGCTFEVPRASLVAKMNGTFSKTGIFLVDIVLTVKKPKKGGRIKMTGTPVAPVSE